jgi:hypothetical protein
MTSKAPRLASGLAALGLALWLAACGSIGTSQAGLQSPGPPGHFDEAGIVFDYPAAWREFHYDFQSSFTSLVAYLATVDVPDPCVRWTGSPGEGGAECGARYTLGPNDAVVEVSADGFPGFNLLDTPANAAPLTVDGLPAWVEAGTGVPGDQGWTWTIARPGSTDNFYRITATVHGPDLATIRAQLDALVASLHYTTPVAALPTDPGAAERAARKALSELVSQSPIWGCFPPPGQTRRAIVASLPNGPSLTAPKDTTCTTTIEPTRLQLWRMTLTMTFSHLDANAGAGEVFVQWLDPNGTLNAQGGEMLLMPSPGA